MSVHRVRAGTDASGRLTAIHHHIAAQPTSPNLPYVGDVMFTNDVDFFTTTGAIDNPYTYPAFKLESSNVETGVPTMVWRSVGNSHTEFARECALDELAHRGGPRPDRPASRAPHRQPADPARPGTGRRRDPAGTSRRRKVTPEVSPAAASSAPAPRSPRSPSTSRGRIHVERIVFALDCGIAINPDLIRAQVEGGLLLGLSAAAWGEIVLGDGGDIVTQNFDRYPVMRMQSVPRRSRST